MVYSEGLNFNDLWLHVNPSRNLSISEGLMHLHEMEKSYNEIHKFILEGYYDDYDDYDRRKNNNGSRLSPAGTSSLRYIGGFVFKIIDGIIQLIAKAIKIVISIVKRLMYSSKAIYLSNTEFLNSYGNAIRRLRSGTRVTLPSSYKMDVRFAINTVDYAANVSARRFDSLLSKVLDVNDALESSDLNELIESTRSAMLKTDSYTIAERGFIDLFNETIGGKSDYARDFYVDDAYDILLRYRDYVKEVKMLSERITNEGENSIKNLNNMKKLIDNNANPSIVKGLDMLSKYRNVTMQDTIVMVNSVCIYIETISTQCKAICIKALQGGTNN